MIPYRECPDCGADNTEVFCFHCNHERCPIMANTYRGYSYQQGENGLWGWTAPDGSCATLFKYTTDEECMDAIDAHKKAQRLAQSA